MKMKTMSVVDELDHRFAIEGVARISEGNGGLPRIQISGSGAEGQMYLHGAQVTSWKPAENDEVLFLSTKSHWREGQAIRGGIPICFPWFRAKVDNAKAPAHGFVRTKSWQLESIVEEGPAVVVTMSTESDEQTRLWWPADFRLLYRVTFDSKLTLELVCTNTGKTDFRFEEALHTYNRVADVANVRLRGLDTVKYLDNTDSNKVHVQQGDVKIASATDNAFPGTGGDVDLIDPQLHRRIGLKKSNSLTTVVWNPWREGAAQLGDLGHGEWAQFLCVEASNVLTAFVRLAPGEEHKMTAVLGIGKL
jgi:glucose-6-phosphate 1-epimerase